MSADELNSANDGQSSLTVGLGVTVSEVQEELRLCQQDAIKLQVENERLRKIESMFKAALDGYEKGVIMGREKDGTPYGYVSVFLDALKTPN